MQVRRQSRLARLTLALTLTALVTLVLGAAQAVAVAPAPAPPTSLAQYQADGTTAIPACGFLSGSSPYSWGPVVFKGVVSDADPGQQVSLAVQVAQNGYFDDSAGAYTYLETGGLGANPHTGSVYFYGSLPGSYQWRARTQDTAGNVSSWVHFGSGPYDFCGDFRINNFPLDATDLAQYQSDGTTAIATGGHVASTSVVLNADVSDYDYDQDVKLAVEVKPLGTAFNDAGMVSEAALGANPHTGSVTVSGLTPGTSYHWQARTIDPEGAMSFPVSYADNAESAADFVVNAKPNGPTALAQYQSNGTTAIPTGAVTGSTDVVLKASVSDPDSGQEVKLQVEVKPVGTAFNETDLVTDSLGTNSHTGSVTVSGLSTSTKYHWRARAIDADDAEGAWVSYGGNTDTVTAATDFATNTPPNNPTGLAQYASDGTTAIPVGSATAIPVVLKGVVGDPDSTDTVKLEVEVRSVSFGFDGFGQSETSLGSNPHTSAVTYASLTAGFAYHWRARSVDEHGAASSWVSFGGNSDNAGFFNEFYEFVSSAADADFTVGNPHAPTDLAQFRSDGTTAIATGGPALSTTVVLRANVSDGDSGEQVKLQVEVKPVASLFDGTGLSTEPLAANPHFGSVTVSALSAGTSYHWRARTVDTVGMTSAWVSFGGNSDTVTAATDFSANSPPDDPTDMAQYRADGTTSIATGAQTTDTTVHLKATASDPDAGDDIHVVLEVKPVATAFDGGSGLILTGSGAGPRTVDIPVADLTPSTAYHWRMKTVDEHSAVSAWVSYGGNAETAADFVVNTAPNAPTALAQYKSDGTTALSTGGVATGQVFLKAAMSDPDTGDLVKLEVEVKAVANPFNESGLGAESSLGANPHTGSVSIFVGAGGFYWRARTVDSQGAKSAWVSYGGNSDVATADADFIINTPPGPPGSLSQYESDGTTALGALTNGTAVVLKAAVNDPNAADAVALEIELKEIPDAFDGTGLSTESLGTNPHTGSRTFSGLTPGESYHWRARAVDQYGAKSAWVVYGDVDEEAADFKVNSHPGDPGSLAQYKSDGTTTLATGALTPETTVVLKGAVSDPDTGDTVKLQVEVKPVGTGFDATGLAAESLGASGHTGSVTISGLSEGQSYHWRARAIDDHSATSAWVNYGSNAESAADFTINSPPSNPTSLTQYKSDGTTALATGAVTNETTVVMKGLASDPDAGDTVKLEVEVKLVGTAFDEVGVLSETLAANSHTGSLTVSSLTPGGSYHWRARTVDEHNAASQWVSYGANAESATDWRVDRSPDSPASLAQYKSDGTTAITTGGLTNETTVVFKGSESDADAGDTLKLQVEVKPVGTEFDSSSISSESSFGANPHTGSVTVSGLSSGTSYHWRARTLDDHGLTSGWVSYGGNSDTVAADTDFHVNAAPIVTGGASQSVQYSDPITAVTLTANDSDSAGSTLTAASKYKVNAGSFTNGLPSGLSLTLDSTGANSRTWVLSGNMNVAPGVYVVRVTVTDGDGASGSDDVTITVTQEDARAYSTGNSLFWTSTTTGTSANAGLAATIKDITPVDPTASPPNPDSYPGDIRNAKVTFVNRDAGNAALTNCSNLPVGLVLASDTKVGTASCTTSLAVGTSGGTSYNIGIKVTNYYTRDAGDDDFVVTAAQPLNTNFISGGGTLLNTISSAGAYPGTAAKKTNFGFTVKYNKSKTNLQGGANILVRSGGRTYQVKSNSPQSLVVDPATGKATFIAKSNIQDVTNPTAVPITGNQLLQLTMDDNGDPGSADMLGITVQNSAGGLWFASNWNGTRTIEQLLGGGNLAVH